ncbi:rcc01693 family protein [Polymorphum gilvum]|uniref:rcc01693 family protein n=1 Tax=Polymorphum gilvum TaxID=991904 RepID=UPI0011D25348|nr:rcc01693 family protein [Polymorphum gilvum]
MSPAAAAFPWAEALQAGLGRLGWTPETFWRATPRELAAALGLARRGRAPARADLDRLLRRFPDRPACASNSQE